MQDHHLSILGKRSFFNSCSKSVAIVYQLKFNPRDRQSGFSVLHKDVGKQGCGAQSDMSSYHQWPARACVKVLYNHILATIPSAACNDIKLNYTAFSEQVKITIIIRNNEAQIYNVGRLKKTLYFLVRNKPTRKNFSGASLRNLDFVFYVKNMILSNQRNIGINIDKACNLSHPILLLLDQ